MALYGATVAPGARTTAELIPESSVLTLVAHDSQPESGEPQAKQHMLLQLLSKPHVLYLLASGFMFNLLGVGAEVVFVLYSYTSVELGGMGRSVCMSISLHNRQIILNPTSIFTYYCNATIGKLQPVQIGYALAGSGALGTVLSLALFPYLQRRFNNRRMYIFFSAFWALAFALMPTGHLAALIPASSNGGTQKRDAFVWLAIALIMVPLRLGVNVSL